MAFLRIDTSNRNLGWVLQKNPSSGMVMKDLRNGMLFGYFPVENGVTSNSSYCIVFKDASDNVSYKRHPDEQFEHLNASKYNNARFVSDAIQELLRDARDKDSEYDEPCVVSVFVNLIETQYKTIDIFKRYFYEVNFATEEITKDNHRTTFSANEPMTVRKMLLIVNLFAIFATLNSDDYTYVTDELVNKYVRISNILDVPYFVKYLLKVRMARSENRFNLIKPELDKSLKWKFEFNFGDTHEMRIAWVKTKVDLSLPIVDIGSGIDFKYIKAYATKIGEAGKKYYAIERDLDARERIKAAVKSRGWVDFVEVFESLDEFFDYYKVTMPNERVNVICTEVLEHNEFNDARKIAASVVENINFDKFVITLPNAPFNVFYGIAGFRHGDHKWEADARKIENLEAAMFNYMKTPVMILQEPVGDLVNDIPVTIGLVVVKQIINE